MPIRLVFADDHELLRDGFKIMLKRQAGIEVVGEAANGEELVKLALETRPDVIITDIKMPIMNGIEATAVIKKELPQTEVIAFSMFDEENLIVDILEAGAIGYVLKNATKQEIATAIETVSRHQPYYDMHTMGKVTKMIAQRKSASKKITPSDFSARELQVIYLICEQKTNKEIAEELQISIRTVENYRNLIQEKIGARNLAGIVVWAVKNKIFSLQ